MSSGHCCPAPECVRPVPRSQLACKRHWFQVPKALRDELWTAYRGDGMGSDRHTLAVTTILDWFASPDYEESLAEAPEWTL